ncbi:Zn-dependent hydrolase [Virgibacillus sp. NKC19-3]|uniref:Zn-dependent hydrolase n=1 Tax=Virgibacillus saliphilus TaxID=2831674 RepID=UPI001C9B536C|nr:Zn-dependent hydrolase [Virgibacillus sp. NKC19-3]MBY7144207.1 Zn-dependent hydrolase [Virgibacillus sp. NKC19-3]
MINKERLKKRLLQLGEIGKQTSGGVTRLAFSKEDREGLELISSYMKEAGLEVRQDAAGNLIGRKEGQNPNASVVITGSHSDTVYEGGVYDGALGVIGAIEATQSIAEQGIVTEHPIEVVAYRDEEGVRFSGGFSGAAATVGNFRPEVLNYVDDQGVTVAEALEIEGLDPQRINEAARKEGSAKAHIELHIEQGKVLEGKNCSVGVVTGICCSSRLRVKLVGEAGHAGTTPMDIRHDPLVSAAEIIQVIQKEANSTGTTVGTVGRLKVHPGGANVIPGMVEFSIDLRDLSREIRDEVEKKVLKQAKEICHKNGIEMKIDVWRKNIPKPCSNYVQKVINNSCEKLDIDALSLSSGAGHDSGNFVDFCEQGMGMIFIRSKDGISHNPAEWSSMEDCADGTEVLYHTILDLAVPVQIE